MTLLYSRVGGGDFQLALYNPTQFVFLSLTGIFHSQWIKNVKFHCPHNYGQPRTHGVHGEEGGHACISVQHDTCKDT